MSQTSNRSRRVTVVLEHDAKVVKDKGCNVESQDPPVLHDVCQTVRPVLALHVSVQDVGQLDVLEARRVGGHKLLDPLTQRRSGEAVQLPRSIHDVGHRLQQSK